MAIFGTDGIRGRFGQPPVTEDAMRQWGLVLGRFVCQNQRSAFTQVMIARDTRNSGPLIEKALIEGLTASGVQPLLAGVLPTPALALAVADSPADLGIMITASHNPSSDNGIKVFQHDGGKLSPEQQQQLEKDYWALKAPPSTRQQESQILENPERSYSQRLATLYEPGFLQGKTILIDNAHGAFCETIEQLMVPTKAQLRLINNAPNGHNINENAGVLKPTLLHTVIAEQKPSYTLAFDGDGDRLVLFIGAQQCDPHHLVILLYEAGVAAGLSGGIVVTEITNRGLIDYCQAQGIGCAITPVGDRFVMAEARRRSWHIGAEPSGHYLIMSHSVSSDPLMAALMVIDYLEKNPRRYNQLQQVLPLYHEWGSKISFATELKARWPELEGSLRSLLPEGNYVATIRPSGTEPLLRLNLQTPDKALSLKTIAEKWENDAQNFLHRQGIK